MTQHPARDDTWATAATPTLWGDHAPSQQPQTPTTPTDPEPDEAAAGSEPLTLDALIQQAHAEAARARFGTAAAEVIRHLATQPDGCATVDDLRAAGYGDQAITDTVVPPSDRRAKPRARLGIVGNIPVVWLTATGWQAAGRASGREIQPTGQTVAHAQAPAALRRWLSDRINPKRNLGVEVRVVYGPACRDFSDRVTAQAWAALKSTGDADGAIGSLTGGLIPDALIVERWSPALSGVYAQAWQLPPGVTAGRDDLAETVVAVEVEDTRKAGDPLGHKVSRWDAALRLGAARAVLWVVRTPDVGRALQNLGVGDPVHRPGQLLTSAGLVGIPGGQLVPVPDCPWWPLHVPAPDQA